MNRIVFIDQLVEEILKDIEGHIEDCDCILCTCLDIIHEYVGT